MGRFTLIVPVGNNIQQLFVGLREFPTNKLILVYTEDKRRNVHQLKGQLEIFRLPIEAYELKGNILEDMLDLLFRLRKRNKNLIVHTSTADASMASIILSVANIMGITAFTVVGDTPLLLPTFKVDLSRLVSKRKLEILNALLNGPLSFSELGKKVKLSPPLLSYHLNGDRKNRGLLQSGLVVVEGGPKNKIVSLSRLGSLILKYLNI
ncbi:MAG: winged helix-turn-helix domain-containing protein [Thermoprotei archaeon]